MPARPFKKVLSLSLGFLFMFAQAEAALLQQRRQATDKEEMQMLGMILGAVQDAYGGYVGEARELYEKLIAADPNNANAYGNLGNVYLDEGDIESAVANYEKAAARTNNKEAAAQTFLNAGFQYAERGDQEKALLLYRRALEISPNNALAYTDIGWSLLKTGKPQEAIKAFEKALKLNPSKEGKEYAQQGLSEARARK